jgi:superfamily I DNA/RNA helicase
MNHPSAVPSLAVMASRRFMDDVASLPEPIARKVDAVVRRLREHGAYYPGLETRKIAGNPDGRFRLMDVDDSYRIVAALDGGHAFLEKVGPHDPTERWGETATLRDYRDRLEVGPESLVRTRRVSDRPRTAEMFDIGPSLAEIAEADAVSDVLIECVEGVLEGWAEGTLEDWMIFLSPVQRRAVDRAVNGPSRVTGGPGTGKTVVGLHRAAALARTLPDDDGRILMTSFVRTIPKVLEGLFERLAPDVAHRVEFRTVHSLANRVLGRLAARVDDENAKGRFQSVLGSDPARYRQLVSGARFSLDYLWEEVTRVIIGRGVGSREAYLALARHGRRRPMPALIRSLVWDVWAEYLKACASIDPVYDFNLMLLLALEQARKEPPSKRYAAIIVDEAQDITEVGVRLLLEHLEGGADGRLMLVGDGGQRIYPGGYRLSDLGLETRGRSFSLNVCYRSTDEIMQAVAALGRYLSPEEYGEDGLGSLAASTVRTGPRPAIRSFESREDEEAWVIDQLDPDDERIDATAILTYTNTDARHWQAVLSAAGIGSVELTQYSGRPTPGVKVGTYHRAKGLEFERLFLPGLDARFPYGDRDEDRIVLYGAAFYVAMSRARDQLTLTYAGAPSMFLDPVREHCEVIASGGGPVRPRGGRKIDGPA